MFIAPDYFLARFSGDTIISLLTELEIILTLGSMNISPLRGKIKQL